MHDLTFYKVQSLGNDLILLDWREEPIEKLAALERLPEWSAWVRQVCHRHFGVGGDGILVLGSSAQGGLSCEMSMFNADGARAEKCLNGVRCGLAYVMEETARGDHVIRMGGVDYRLEASRFNTGESAEPALVVPDVRCLGPRTVQLGGETLQGWCVDVGNPHFVLIGPYDREAIMRIGTALQHHEDFPHGTNVEFLTRRSDDAPTSWELFLFERGCGPTLSSGSGCAAAMSVLREVGMIQEGQRVRLQMPGGILISWWSEEKVYQKAPAIRVFRGVMEGLWDPEELPTVALPSPDPHLV
ncbi:MAG: diaminopimelate epimerase [Chlamydiia bacterium]